jgi:hypothetical protein
MTSIALLAILAAAAPAAGAAGIAERAEPDTIPPTIESARVLYDPDDPQETGTIEFVFSEPVDWFQAIHPNNYTDLHSGQTAFQGFWFPPNRTEIRFPNPLWGYGTCEQVRVVNVVDLAGNEIVDDGAGNAFTFHLQQVLVLGRMSVHMQAHDAPPHSFAIEGNVAPLTWSPNCDVPLEDADGDSVWTQLVFFDLPCSSASGGAATQDVEFLFCHRCNELEPIANRLLSLDLALQPDGRDTLDLWWADGVPTDAGALSPRPLASGLGAISPNPTRSGAAIAFSLADAGPVALDVLDVRGRVVRRLGRGLRPAGAHGVTWDGRTDRGTSAAPGVYFVRFEVPAGTSARRIVLAR